MKLCRHCNTEKLLDQFSKNKTKKDGYQDFCKPCNSERSKAYYNKNKEKHGKEVYKNKLKRMAKNKKYINDFKIKCSKCSETHISCLEFHHVNKNKKFNISNA